MFEDETPIEEPEVKAIEEPVKVSSLMGALKKTHTAKFGEEAIFDGTDKKVIGLDVYPLALQYLMGIGCLPLGTIVQIAGEPKTYKTSTALEFCNFFFQSGGIAMKVNTEGKYSVSKLQSIITDEKALQERFELIQAESNEQWQEAAITTINAYAEHKARAKNKKADWEDLVPGLIAVDSLVGSQSMNIKTKIDKAGHAEKTVQDRAMQNTMFFNSKGAEIANLPLVLLVTNHLKDSLDMTGYGGPKKITSGGTATNFHCSFNFHVKRGKTKITEAHGERIELIWTTNLNSYGPARRKIVIPYYEKWDDEGVQHAYFDWDEALILLLMDIKAAANPGQYKSHWENIKAKFGNIVESPRHGGAVYNCDYFGIDTAQAKDDGITASVLGRMIQQDPEARTILKKLLGIETKSVVLWSPDVYSK